MLRSLGVGRKGDSGSVGPQGQKGDTGAAGPQGQTGVQGATGAQGPQGISGAAVLKYAQAALTTNASGVWTKTFAAGFFSSAPSFNFSPRMAAGSGAYNVTFSVTGTVAAGFSVTATFTRIAPTVSILVLGTVNVVLNGGTVTFDVQAFETVGSP